MLGTHSRGRTNQDEYRTYSGENAGAYFPDRVEERLLIVNLKVRLFSNVTIYTRKNIRSDSNGYCCLAYCDFRFLGC